MPVSTILRFPCCSCKKTKQKVNHIQLNLSSNNHKTINKELYKISKYLFFGRIDEPKKKKGRPTEQKRLVRERRAASSTDHSPAEDFDRRDWTQSLDSTQNCKNFVKIKVVPRVLYAFIKKNL